jgi:predicted Zn-ribbon and HTH transcriptional regulator
MKCPKCNSHDIDPATVGLPGAMQCLDCGYLFPDIMGRVSWPFPTSLQPKKSDFNVMPKYNPNNEDDAPM